MHPLHVELKKFQRGLETGRPYTTFMSYDGEDHEVQVRALGHMSSPQFTMLTRPSEYSNSWLDLDKEPVRVPGMVYGGEFSPNNPEHLDLEQRIMKEGVQRPVIVGDRKSMALPPTSSNPERRVRGMAYPMVDGHHRAFYAVRHGLHIPVVQMTKYIG